MTIGSGGGVGNGYFTEGAPVISGAYLSAASCIPVDTGLAGGASPVFGGIIPGTLPAPATQIGLTALAGGAKAGATQLGYGINTVTVVATAADSVLLPYAFPGAMCFVKNADAADSMTVFGKGTDTIDAVATATGNAQAAGKGKLYYGTAGSGDGTDAGAWVTLLGA